jgi:large subunit ribosomal protein L18
MTRRIKLEFRRATMLKSEIPRLVVRKTNKYIIMQIVKNKEAQDQIICCANSIELKKLGWSGSFKNIGAAYLTGILIAKKAIEKKIKSVIPDFGIYRSTKGSKLYAALKGVKKGGIEINFKDEMAPSEERLMKDKEEQFKKIEKKL